jgi:hypothetical protein
VRERHLTRAAAGDTAMARAAAAKARRIERHNLGRKKLSAQRVRDRAVTKDAVYQAVHDLVDTPRMLWPRTCPGCGARASSVVPSAGCMRPGSVHSWPTRWRRCQAAEVLR